MIRSKSYVTPLHVTPYHSQPNDTSALLASMSATPPRTTSSIPGGSKLWSTLAFILSGGVVVYILLLLSSPNPLQEHKRPLHSVHSNNELTVVINTFKRPPSIVADAIEYYASCDIVRYVHIIWCEQEAPPQRLTAKYATWQHPNVYFNRQPTDSLNNRFRPLEGPHTDAIFAVDDDMRVPCADLSLAFEVWQGAPRSLVGYMPRLHLRGKDQNLVYRCWWRVWWHGVYSIILTKAAILHHDFFAMYTNDLPKEIHALVDRERNCEDIAMQFLMANVTGLPPIYVKGHLEDLGALNGISTRQNVATAAHMDRRSMCLNELAKIFGRVPLVPSHMIIDSASNGWTNVPSSWWEFISSDLWKW